MATSDYRKDPGHFVHRGNIIESQPGSTWGVYWCKIPLPADFVLRIESLREEGDDNSGSLSGFRIQNVHTSEMLHLSPRGRFEVQIDERGSPDGVPYHRTGAIYGKQKQSFSLRPARPLGKWNVYEIEARGQNYVIHLNGAVVSEFTNHDPNRGMSTSKDEPSYFGVQAERGHVQFRNIGLKSL
jgi:hypothetical protein